MRVYIRVCVYSEAADERHMKMSVACASYTRVGTLYIYTMYILVIYDESADERHMKMYEQYLHRLHYLLQVLL
jgi:hypothetical protein